MTIFAHPRALSAVAAGFFLWVSPAAQGQKIRSLWDGSTADWTSTANWIHTPGDLGADYPDSDDLTYDVEITSGEINMDGAYTVGKLTMSGGYLVGSGNLTLNEGFHTSGELIQIYLPQITISGTSVWQAANLEFLAGAVMEANHFGYLALGDGTVANREREGSFNNHGTLHKSFGDGMMLFSGKTEFHNFGAICVDTGTLAIAQRGTIGGMLHVGEGARLDFVHPFGEVHFVSGTSFNGPGTVRFAQGWSQFDGPVTNHTTIELSQTGFFGDGPFVNNSNGLVRMLTSSDWDVDTINLGVLRVHGPGGTLSSRRFENRGLLEIVTSAYVPNNFYQTHLVNHGELRSVAAAPVDLGVSVSVNNEGLIHATAGDLHLSGGGTNSGTLTTTSNAVIVLSGDHFFADGSSLAGNIRLLSSATVTGNVTNFGSFESVQAIGGPGNLYVAGGATLLWSGEMGGTGATIVLPGGTLLLSNNASLNDRTIRNDGSMRCEGYITCDGGRILNRGGLAISQSFTIVPDLFGKIPVVENEGVLTISSTLGPVAFQRIGFTNRGDVLIESGGLRFTRAYVQTAGQTLVRGGSLIGESEEADIYVFSGRLALSGTNRCNRLRVDATLELAAGSLINVRQIILTNTSVVECEIGPAGSGIVDGHEWSTLNGTLRLRLAQGFLPAAGMRYTVLRDVFPGTQFSWYEGLEIGNGLRLVPHYTGFDLEVVVMNAPYPGQRGLVLELPRFQPLRVSWPSEFAGFYLQRSTNLSNPQWTTMFLTWTNDILLSANGPQQFFRLVHPDRFAYLSDLRNAIRSASS